MQSVLNYLLKHTEFCWKVNESLNFELASPLGDWAAGQNTVCVLHPGIFIYGRSG